MIPIEQGQSQVEKVTMAGRLRAKTLVRVAWIAGWLEMGSVANVSTLLYRRWNGKVADHKG